MVIVCILFIFPFFLFLLSWKSLKIHRIKVELIIGLYIFFVPSFFCDFPLFSSPSCSAWHSFFSFVFHIHTYLLPTITSTISLSHFELITRIIMTEAFQMTFFLFFLLQTMGGNSYYSIFFFCYSPPLWLCRRKKNNEKSKKKKVFTALTCWNKK